MDKISQLKIKYVKNLIVCITSVLRKAISVRPALVFHCMCVFQYVAKKNQCFLVSSAATDAQHYPHCTASSHKVTADHAVITYFPSMFLFTFLHSLRDRGLSSFPHSVIAGGKKHFMNTNCLCFLSPQ